MKVGTIFEDSPLGLEKWLPAMWMLVNAKNGVSSHEIGRALGVRQATAWRMAHRIREAMRTGSIEKLKGEVEADETYIGGKRKSVTIIWRAAEGRTNPPAFFVGHTTWRSIMVTESLPGRQHFAERLAQNKPGEEKMLLQLRQLLVSFGARKHDGDGFFHFPGHGWVSVECKSRVREDGCFYWEKQSYHDAQAKLSQCKVLVIVDESNPRACWLTDVRIVGAKGRTPAQPHTSGDPGYVVTTRGEDGVGAFAPLGEFVRSQCRKGAE